MNENNYQHPSKDIIESKGTILRGKTICMCLTGSVAVITAPIIARELMRFGTEVIAVMTKAATELINPALMHWATGNPAITELTGAVEHVFLAGARPRALGKADLILVCPATANTISKIANGIDDTPVTTVVSTAFGASIPIIVVPTSYNQITAKDLSEAGINVVIYANHMLRAAYPGMMNVAKSILDNDRSMEAEKDLLSIKKILDLIPGTK